MKNIIKLSIMSLMVVMTLSLCSCSIGRTEIDLKDYVTVEFYGCNGYARPIVSVDYDALEKNIDFKLMNEYYMELFPESTPDYYLLGEACSAYDLIEYSDVEGYNNMSNGDKLTLEFTINENLKEKGQELSDLEKALKIKFINTTITFDVEGLTEPKTLDIKIDVGKYVNFSGASGSGTGRICFPDGFEFEQDGFYFSNLDSNGDYDSSTIFVERDNTRIGSIRYYIEQVDDNGAQVRFSNGDKCTINSSISSDLDSYMKNHDYLISIPSIDFTVSGLGTYVTKSEQLTKENKEAIKEEMMKKAFETIYEGSFDSMYFGTIKPDRTTKSDAKCIVLGLVKIPIYDVVDHSIYDWGYMYCIMCDPILKNDKVYFEEFSDAGDSKVEFIQEYLEKQDFSGEFDDFNLEKIY